MFDVEVPSPGSPRGSTLKLGAGVLCENKAQVDIRASSCQYCMIISLYYLEDHITMLYDHIIISCHGIIRSHHQVKAQAHQASFQATPRQPQATQRQTFGSECEIGEYTSKTQVIPGRSRALVTDNGKSFGGKLRMFARYTFYRRILQKVTP